MAAKNIMGIRQNIIFWIILATITIPAAWFIYSSYVGLNDILEDLKVGKSTMFPDKFMPLDAGADNLMVRAYLEYDVLTNRQSRTNSTLATRTWLRFMSSVFGAILIFVGAVFVLAKIETTSESNVEGKAVGVGFILSTSSPGLVLAVIGAVLMIVPNTAEQRITANDAPSFIGGVGMADFVEQGPSPRALSELTKLKSGGQ